MGRTDWILLRKLALEENLAVLIKPQSLDRCDRHAKLWVNKVWAQLIPPQYFLLPIHYWTDFSSRILLYLKTFDMCTVQYPYPTHLKPSGLPNENSLRQ